MDLLLKIEITLRPRSLGYLQHISIIMDFLRRCLLTESVSRLHTTYLKESIPENP